MFYSLLNEVYASWDSFIKSMTGLSEEQAGVLTDVFGILSTILWVALAIVGAIGSIYAIYLGVQLSRAEDQSKRDDAKKHLITVVIAIGVTIALILIFNVFLPMLLGAFNVGQSVTDGSGNTEGGKVMITPVLNMIKCRI